MKKYLFTYVPLGAHRGETIEVEAENELRAMGKANDHFDDLPFGRWMIEGKPDRHEASYRWSHRLSA